MGRKKVGTAPRKQSYPPLHIHSLPYEILLQIFALVAEDMNSLLLMALVCSKFNSIASKNYLYHTVKFKTDNQFLRFAHAHLPQKKALGRRFGSTESSTRINFLRSVHFINPPTNDASTQQVQIAGSYTMDTLSYTGSSYLDYISCMKLLLTEAYGLKEVRISEISPQFQFPAELMHALSFSAINLRFKTPRPLRSIEKVVLTAQSGWNIPFKVEHLAIFVHLFGEVEELRLNKFVLSDQKLVCVPLEKPFVVNSLVLTASIYSEGKRSSSKRVSNPLFAKTSFLLLEDIQNGNDLSLIDYIKCNNTLLRLSIDISSSIFYEIDPTDHKPKFCFHKYNNFFKLVCLRKGGYSTLQEVILTNFDLFNSFAHQHDHLQLIREENEDEEDDWVAPPTNTLEFLMKYLSQVPYLTIVVKEAPAVVHTCVKCGFQVHDPTKRISSLLPHEWAIIVAPILASKLCSLLIYDHKLRPLYSRRAAD